MTNALITSFANRFRQTPTPAALAMFATVLLRESHRQAFVDRAPLAANDGASFTTETFWMAVRA